MRRKNDRDGQEDNRDGWSPIVAWVLVLFGLTAVGVIPLYIWGPDVRHLSPQTVTLPVGLGIEISAYAPSLAAVLVAAFVSGGGGARRLLAQLGGWRRHLVWYAIALLGPLFFFLAANTIRTALGNPSPASWFAMPSGFAIGSIIAGSFGEEIGWRGFGQSRLQRRSGALVASLVIGVIWTVWHDWGVFAPGGLSDFTAGGFTLSLLRMCSLSVLYAWLYNGSRQSLPVAMSAHAGHNIANNVVPSTAGGLEIGEIVTFFYVAAAIAVVALTRKRLAFDMPATATIQ